jgi:hypothetical protein
MNSTVKNTETRETNVLFIPITPLYRAGFGKNQEFNLTQSNGNEKYFSNDVIGFGELRRYSYRTAENAPKLYEENNYKGDSYEKSKSSNHVNSFRIAAQSDNRSGTNGRVKQGSKYNQIRQSKL